MSGENSGCQGGPPVHAPRVAALLSHRDYSVVVPAAKTLAKLDASELQQHIPALAGALAHADWRAQRAARRCL